MINEDIKKQRNITISDETWATLLERAVLEETTASQICEMLLTAYLKDEIRYRPAAHRDSPRLRSIYTSNELWAAARKQRVFDRRSISETLEGLLGHYLGL